MLGDGISAVVISSQGLQVSRVPTDLVDYVFDQLPIERGLRYGAGDSTTTDHMRDAVKHGASILWCVHDGGDLIAGVVLSVQEHPAKRTVLVEMAAGRDIDRWMETVERLLIDYRDLVGADTIEAFCRPGMARKLGRWRRKSELMELG